MPVETGRPFCADHLPGLQIRLKACKPEPWAPLGMARREMVGGRRSTPNRGVRLLFDVLGIKRHNVWLSAIQNCQYSLARGHFPFRCLSAATASNRHVPTVKPSPVQLTGAAPCGTAKTLGIRSAAAGSGGKGACGSDWYQYATE